MANESYVIGVYGFAFLETLHRGVLGLLRYCNEAGGLQIRDFRTQSTADFEIRPPWKGRCDGVVLATGRPKTWSDDQVADWVVSGGVPAVSILADWQDRRIPCFHIDHEALARLAAAHLVACGCKSYLFFGYAASTGSAAWGRAFRETLAGQGRRAVEYAASQVYLGSVEDEKRVRREKGLARLLRDLPKPLGVWAINDIFASALCLACGRAGLVVPDSVKVLGTNDLAIARTHNPPLSSICTPREMVGYLAMKTLHGMLKGKRPKRADTAVAPEEVVARESTAGDPVAAGTLEAAVEYIARHACSGMTIRELLKAMPMSEDTFSAQFQQRFGRTPYQEVQRVRLEVAKGLLQQRQLSVARIASMIGFADTAAFSKFFTKHAGMSPRAYRNRKS